MVEPGPAYRPIARLDPKLRDRIAAGEVVQRPASVLKELIENALDAGADAIEINAADGGTAMLSVSDNGRGIPKGQFGLAVENHATSKIATEQELESIASLGFRGEALASICSAAVVELHSRAHDSDEAWQAVSHPDQDELAFQPKPRVVGTTVTVKDLFAHIPARRKFLKAERTEAAQLSDVVENYMLAYPQVRWKYAYNGRVTKESAPGQARDAALGFLKVPVSELVEFSEQGPLFGYHLLAAQPRHTSARRNGIKIFLNGRPIEDKSVAHAIVEGFGRWIPHGRFPKAVLMLEVDPSWVDVNVHPAKTQVRFTDGRLLHDFLFKTIRHNLGQQAGFSAPQTPAQANQLGRAPASSSRPGTAGGSFSGGASAGPYRSAPSPQVPSQSAKWGKLPTGLERQAPLGGDQGSADAHAGTQIEVLGQIMAKFIVAKVDGALWLIDQHAAHEALNYVRIRDAILEGKSGATQMLLVPSQVSLAADAYDALQRESEAVRALGFDVAFDEDDCIAIRGVPDWSTVDNEAFLTDWAHELCHGTTSDDVVPLNVFAAERACKASLKANDRLSPPEMHQLVYEISRLSEGAACPHGRPTRLVYDEHALDRLFQRLGH